jgi:hypothetical protein
MWQLNWTGWVFEEGTPVRAMPEFPAVSMALFVACLVLACTRTVLKGMPFCNGLKK